MKTKIKNAAVVLLIMLAVAVCWWLLKSSLDVVVSPNVAPPVPKTVQLPPSEPKSTMVQPNARTPYLGLADPRWIERRRLRKEDPSYQWRTPIEFFGKVIDEKGQPVPEANIEVAWSGTVERNGGDGVGHRTLTSDVKGLFTLTGVEGKGITVRVSKAGYHVPRTSNMQWFEYAGFWEPTFIEPDRNNPVIFHLVKRPAAELTYHVGGRLLLPPPSWVTHLDLSGNPAESNSGGDITVRIMRPPNAGYQNPFDWELQIEGNDGTEFIESDEEFMLRAPDDGYQNAIIKHYQQMRGNQSKTILFYVRSKVRKLYAAVSLDVTPYYPMINVDKASIRITAIVNPNDSPNLEYDPKKDIHEIEKAKNP